MSVLGGSQGSGLRISNLVILVGGSFTSVPLSAELDALDELENRVPWVRPLIKAIHSSFARMGRLLLFPFQQGSTVAR